MALCGDRAVNDLPHDLGSLVGREGETVEIASLLASARLFTLTGTGGVGKTRLAAQLAAESRAIFPDGVRWVDLGPLVDPALVPHAVAACCDVPDRAGVGVLDALAAALGHQKLLLVLDNCEHLLAECARLVEALLAAGPRLHVLTTSREALAVPGEVIWLVAPLRVPEHDAVAAVEDLLAYEAVALFVARAAAVLPGFRLTAENAASVVRICRRVEGLPLALELAAARLRVLSASELAERLDDAPRLLTRGSRTAPPRQQTLRATLDWSHTLLTDAERAVFARLAVFPASFSLAVAEAVSAGDGVAEGDVLDVLSRLVEKSLVTVHDRGTETRFRLLEPLRQYARERLVEMGEVARAERRYRDWYAELAGRASVDLSGPDQGRWLDRLEAEHENLRAALGWSLAHEEPAAAGQIAAGAWQFWLLRGYLREGRRWLEQILAMLSESTPLRAHLLWVAGILSRPDFAQAERQFRESLLLWQGLGDRDGTARALGSLGFLAQELGDHARAAEYLERGLPLARASDDTPAIARLLTGLALCVLDRGDAERATSLCHEGLDLCQKAGDLRGEAAAAANLGLIWRARGDEQRAAALWEESLALRQRIGDRGGEAHVLALLADLAADQGAHAHAAALYQESLALRQRTGDQHGVAQLLEGLAAVGAAQGDLIRVVKLAGAAETLREASGVPPSPRERAAHAHTISILRSRLNPEAFTQAWKEGRVLSLEQVLAGATAMAVPEMDRDPRLAVSPQPAQSPAQTYALTRREIDVLRLLTFGLTYAQIAETLVISPRTVDAHVRAIFGKLDVHSRSAATRVALLHRLV
jgi:predicted ATPase/DNA-binding CsgD family transcriptional regulator